MIKKNPLGRKIISSDKYNKNLLFFIPRKVERKKNNIDEKIFNGFDLWNIHELSFLNHKGVPQNRTAKIIYSADSTNIVESKSLKLYLYSFAMTKFQNDEEIIMVIQNDLKKGLKTESVMVFLSDYSKDVRYIKIPKNLLIDDIDVNIIEYKLNTGLLKTIKTNRKKTIKHYSNILKTNCPITGQPDWATVFIEYKSEIIVDPSSLFKYLISYRTHNDYHESCCEKIFMDLFNILMPEKLTVKCFYTRRGGIDINPARFYGVKPDKNYDFCYWRQ